MCVPNILKSVVPVVLYVSCHFSTKNQLKIKNKNHGDINMIFDTLCNIRSFFDAVLYVFRRHMFVDLRL